VVGALQSAEAIKILIGAKEINRDIIFIDVWEGTFHRLKVHPRKDCPACQGRYDFLQVKFGIRTTILCGQNSVQVLDPRVQSLSLEKLAKQLEPLGKVSFSESTLRFTVDGHEMVIFPDGRVILRNSFDEPLARELYVKYIAERSDILVYKE
jgi:adenylyltransferase/sulfurtransferase